MLFALGAFIFYIRNPYFVLFYEGDIAQRPIPMPELVCVILAFCFALAALPRIYFWETFGEQRCRYTALVGALVAIVIPSIVYLFVRVPDKALPRGVTSLPILGNVIVAASLAIIFFVFLGAVAGGLAWIGSIFFIVDLQARNVAVEWLPFTWTFIDNGGDIHFDYSWHWLWLVVMPTIALIVAYKTRLVPFWGRHRL
ncbi:MAG: hypothetical protein IKS49_03485 [Actinomycetaceae bacterium]|nr:hypothetical protein [Actinomycetaceae bacterium]